MNLITFDQATDLALSWSQSRAPMVIAFIDRSCNSCNEYLELAVPVIEEYGFSHYCVNLSENRVAFPPAYVPQTYWFFVDNHKPMVKRGAPPSKNLLVETLEKMLRVYRSESTIEEEF